MNIKISLQAKSALNILVLYHSPLEQHQEYVADVSLLPPYHLTPEIVQELQSAGLINQHNVPTSTGIWFTYNCGVSDNPPAFSTLVKVLSSKAKGALALFCIGDLAKEHETTRNPKKPLEIEHILKNVERFLMGTTASNLLEGVPFKEKSIQEIVKDYDKILEYNNKKSKK